MNGLTRRHWLAGAAAAPLFLRHARAADVPRFAHGIASGQPQASRVVLWTMLTGPDLTPEVKVQWEIAEDEAFTRIAARGSETARLEDAVTGELLATATGTYVAAGEERKRELRERYGYRLLAIEEQASASPADASPATARGEARA